MRNSGNYIYDYVHSLFGKVFFNPSRYTDFKFNTLIYGDKSHTYVTKNVISLTKILRVYIYITEVNN